MAVIPHTNSEFPQEKLPCMFLDLQAAILICDQNFWINKCKMFGKFIKHYSKRHKALCQWVLLLSIEGQFII